MFCFPVCLVGKKLYLMRNDGKAFSCITGPVPAKRLDFKENMVYRVWNAILRNNTVCFTLFYI